VTPRRTTRRGCLLAVSLVVVGLLAPTVAVATTIGTGGSYGALFGVGGTGFIGPGGAAQLVSSAFSLQSVDVTSGHLHGGNVGRPSTLDNAVGMDLAAQELMAVDLQAVAERARQEALRKRAAAETAARKSGVAVERSSDPGVPESWEVKEFSRCGDPNNASFESRIELVDLWDLMCADAAKDGVTLSLNSAFRSPRRQKALWQDAITQYGSTAAARKWVAPSDGINCSSRHCSGTAVDVNVTRYKSAETWLHAPVGCASPGAPDLSRTSCASGERTIKRVQLYGLVLPLPHEPWHVELGVILPAGKVAGDCDPAASLDVPQTIAAVWRCRLSSAGLDAATVDRTVAEALVVSKCESGWDPNAVVFGGQFVDRVHPRFGTKFTAKGLWQFIRSTAETWVPGGYANAADPVVSSDAAARLWLSGYRKSGRTGGWGPWACAVPSRDGHNRANSVLPGMPGGPASLPVWATRY
jgi:hypothetical protein